MSTFAVVSTATGAIENRVILLTREDWPPVEGYSIIEETGEHFDIGGTYIGGVYSPPPGPVDPPVDLMAYAANKRWEREVGGMVVGGMTILTDDRSKLLINGAYSAAKEDPNFETVWGGDYPLNAAQIIAVGKALADHVNACWKVYTSVKSDIANEVITDTAAIDAAFAA